MISADYLKKFWPIYLLTALLCLAATLAADRTITTIAQSVPIVRYQTIVIDAGHGGEDGGAVSCTGVPESRINLEIALRLRDLCHLLGYNTCMIRTEDISVYTEGNTLAAKKASDLRQRVRIANGSNRGVLLSIHQNTFTDNRYDGAQVFYAPTEGSKELADILQSNLIAVVNGNSHRKSKEADNVYLMQHIDCTGVLIECGFLSNPEEEAKLRNSDYQKKICCVIVSSLGQYFKT